MRLVLDSSVAIKWRLPESDSDKAIQYRDRYMNGDDDLIAPDIFPVEVGHALSRAERRGILKPPEASEALRDILLVAPLLQESLPLLKRSMEISSEIRGSVYDCLYVALAEREDCTFLTADRKLFHSVADRALPVGVLLLG